MTSTEQSATVAWFRRDRRRFDVAVAVLVATIGTALLFGRSDLDTGWPEVAAGVGAFAIVLFRRSAPLPLFALALVWTVAHVMTQGRPAPIVFATLVLLATACVRLDRRPATLLGLATAIILYVTFLLGIDTELGDDRSVIGIAWTAAAVGVADATRSWRRYRRAAAAELEAAVAAAEAQASRQVSDERLSIARELHDLLAHNLSVMNVQTGAAMHLLRSNPDGAEAALTVARNAGRNVLDELQGVLTVLRSDDHDQAETTSLPSFSEVETLVESMRASGLDIEWTQVGRPRSLTPAASLAAYRITQEALTNAGKHGLGPVTLETSWAEDGLTIGTSNLVARSEEPATTAGGHGLVGMEERATANGGKLSTNAADGLFSVEAWLPVEVS